MLNRTIHYARTIPKEPEMVEYKGRYARLSPAEISHLCLARNKAEGTNYKPHYSNDSGEAPQDWDGGLFLCRDGMQMTTVFSPPAWRHSGFPTDIIGYHTRAEQSGKHGETNMTRHNARWIKPDDRRWMQHDIAPPKRESKHGSAWFIAALVIALVGFMAYGMVQGDKKADPVAAETWVVAQ